ncbi:hypothetical protein BDN71DRAFT_1506533 [Pleurotus eryngii]|uniref:lytic cellulose monooxygenase (C4-dehydrogenating) n=1 Tax=Pleurotus eryngii TaxID=5323 RepID=A0A9P5ZY27_PLEER|nr:hypothetical protein BDN71DRAFT_1506533 [Pleurotus eryngii]
MRAFTLLSAIALASGVSAHCTLLSHSSQWSNPNSCVDRFTSLIVGTATTSPYQYVRSNTNSTSITYVTSDDLRCDTGGLASGPNTQTATVSTGTTDRVNPIVDIFVGVVCVAGAPVNVATSDFDGSEIVPITDGGSSITWTTDNLTQFSFQLPEALPSGQYLLRVEHIALHSASSFGGAQIYISCAQLNVIDGGNGTPGPLVAIPGVYDGHEPGIRISTIYDVSDQHILIRPLDIYWPVPVSYTQPGPAVWLG